MKSRALTTQDVKIEEGFWQERQKINSTVTVDAVYDRFYETGRVTGFDCNWKPGDDEALKPHHFWDSDVAKWIEGAAYILMHEERPDLEEKVDAIVDMIERNMLNDGYYNMYYIPFALYQRFTNRDMHELYCAGHHFEGAVAYNQATGKNKYLDLMCRYADLIYRIFIEEKSAKFETPGHPEIELALIKLYRTTKNPKHLELCKYFIEKRGNNDKDTWLFENAMYGQDNVPLRQASEAVGHSVRNNYLWAGVCDLAYETGDQELFESCRRVFDNIVNRRMYITGAQGSVHIGERYTVDYHLPNKSAYAETCAALSLAMLAQRMSLYELDSRYADTVERALYNGSLAGVSLEGDAFFYENPLEFRDEDYAVDYGAMQKNHHTAPRTRKRVFNCSCCPPNILRVIADIGSYAYSYAEEEDMLIVHQFVASSYDSEGRRIRVATEFPRNGRISVSAAGVAKVAVRIPYYAREFKANQPYEVCGGYAVFEASADIEIDLGLKVRFVYANSRVYDNNGRVAVMYGPLVYCAESVDNDAIQNFFIDRGQLPVLEGEYGGVPCIRAYGVTRTVSDVLYSEEPPVEETAELKLIPFFTFANRGDCEMLTYLLMK